MAMRGMLRNLGAKGAANSHDSSAGAVHLIDDKQRLAMLDAFEEDEIGWFWATDTQNRLIYLSNSAKRRLGEGRQVIGEAGKAHRKHSQQGILDLDRNQQ